MGEVTRILITGASGFVGSAAVRAARARGLEVVALYRTTPRADWGKGVTPLQIDLSAPDARQALAQVMPGVQAVIHAAAHLGGDAREHQASTLHGTQALLDAMEDSPARLVLVSSITVYDTMALRPGDTLDENSPLEHPGTARNAYTSAKLRQELMARNSGRDAWLIRPGIVWGPGRTWHALMGFWASKLHVQIASDGELPTVHVDHLAAMLVQAALTDPQGVTAVNALDDDRPTRGRFLAAHRRMTGWPRLVLPVPYGLWLAMTRLLSPVSAYLPGLFREPLLRARMMPLRYPNTALRHALNGEDSDTFEGMMARSTGGAP